MSRGLRRSGLDFKLTLTCSLARVSQRSRGVSHVDTSSERASGSPRRSPRGRGSRRGPAAGRVRVQGRRAGDRPPARRPRRPLRLSQGGLGRARSSRGGSTYHPIFPGRPGLGARRIETEADVERRDRAAAPQLRARGRPPRRCPTAGSRVARSPSAIVTGASRGLGLALARALAERGWRLVVDARGADGARARGRAASTASSRSPATSPTPRTAARSSRPPATAIDLLVNNAEHARPEPAAAARRLPARRARARLRGQRPRAARARAAGAAAARGRRGDRQRHLRRRASSRTRAGAATARRRRRSSSSRRSSPPSSPSCASTRSTRATCARRCTRRPSPARTSPTGRLPEESVPGPARR